ncbi:MAG: PAS domain-containing protein, partial [Verrucomicrobiales bacterium]|nr:PAS domain-containing protein [Verrucomicrobiales bacterium]
MEKSNSLDVKNQQLLTDPAELIERIDQLEKELASRREIAVELAKSEERYALAIRGTHDGIWDWEIGTEDVFFSPRFKELLGYTGGEMSGNLPDFFSRLHPLDIKPTTEAIIAHLEEEKPYDIEYRLRHENGKYRWFHARGEAIRNEAGQPIRMSGAITDITQKKADELKLRLISNRLILATRAGKIGVWDYDIIKNVLVWDDMMYKVYGVDPKRFTVAYEAWEKGLHPDDREREREKLQSAIRGETEFDTDFRIIWPSDGSIHYIKANGIVVRDQSGQAIRMIGANWDITESRRIQEELHIARQKAEAAAKAKSEFLANMSHEIRTPMNGIMGFTELLLATDLDETQQEYLELMRQSSETLLTLINDILDFSKIEAGKLNLDLHDFQLRDMLADTLHPLSIKAADKGIEVALRIEPDVPDNLIGDSGRLRQIIVNLVGNGIKFTGNGEVVLRVSLDTRKKDKVTIHFFVSDTGIGIEPDKQKTIFDSFTQAEGSTTRHFGGTGLGLSICRRFVEMMGGEIQVESEPGKGSTFHFPINLEINHEALQPRASRKKLEGQPVLIVDDNATNRRILNDMLLSWKMKPELADSGTKGLKMLEKMD